MKLSEDKRHRKRGKIITEKGGRDEYENMVEKREKDRRGSSHN